MDKEKYITPEMEIVEFEIKDVIVTSGGVPEDDESGLIGNNN